MSIVALVQKRGDFKRFFGDYALYAHELWRIKSDSYKKNGENKILDLWNSKLTMASRIYHIFLLITRKQRLIDVNSQETRKIMLKKSGAAMTRVADARKKMKLELQFYPSLIKKGRKHTTVH